MAAGAEGVETMVRESLMRVSYHVYGMLGVMTRPAPRLEVDSSPRMRGPLLLVAIGIVLSFVIGTTIFVLVSGKETGDPAPGPGESSETQRAP